MNRSLFSTLLSIAALALTLTTSADASTYKVIYTFQGGNDGDQPDAAMIADSAGNLYGTTEFGGSQRYGVVFKLAPGAGGTWTESVLYSFSDGTDGGQPLAGVVMDSAGNLYGTTESGGNASCVAFYGYCGVVYELSPNSNGTWTETVLVDFTDANGLLPAGGLTIDSAGNLYGTTAYGGQYGYGTVFELSNNNGTWTQTILHNFDLKDGFQPNSTLIFDSAGNLYGTTGLGGRSTSVCYDGCGTVFKLTPQGGGAWSFQMVHNFNGTNGASPSGVIFDPLGNLFGATFYGGSGDCTGLGASGCGLVYELSPGTGGAWQGKSVKGFPGNFVVTPQPVVLDSAGNLYGTSEYGGNFSCDTNTGCGTIYQLSLATGGGWTLNRLYEFEAGKNGSFPYAGLTIDNSGNIYGTTGSGGDAKCGATGGCGVVFQITP
jgi:uncharacterized repeat protein (TIGR03803 family)